MSSRPPAQREITDEKLFVILRVFVVDWIRPLPRRREDAKKDAGLLAAYLHSVHERICGKGKFAAERKILSPGV
jgi:hypothetical protein